MIQLRKGPKPNILVERGEGWTRNLLQKIDQGLPLLDVERTHYRHAEVKLALVAETHGKCAYCESELRHIHHGDVEHIYPKSLAPEKTFDWDNLTLACEICNQSKSNRDPHAESIIDPYRDDPAEHFMFSGAVICCLTAMGIASHSILKLYRGELMEQRKKRLEYLIKYLEPVFMEELTLPARRAIVEDFCSIELADNAPYAAMSRAFYGVVRDVLNRRIS